MLSRADQELANAFRQLLVEEGLSPEEFAARYATEEGDPDSSTLRRWAYDSPTRMTSSVRGFFRRIVRELAGEEPEASGPPDPDGASARWPEPEPEDPEDVKAYLSFFGAEAEAFRRMAKRLPLSDLAKGCLDDARAEDMPEAHFAILYDRLAHLL